MSERSKSFYHGTIEHISEGSRIVPGNDGAFASTNLQGVISHTQDRLKTGLGRGVRKDVHHGRIYEVEPYEEDPTLEEATMSGTPDSVVSKIGFKVKQQVASVLKEK